MLSGVHMGRFKKGPRQGSHFFLCWEQSSNAAEKQHSSFDKLRTHIFNKKTNAFSLFITAHIDLSSGRFQILGSLFHSAAWETKSCSTDRDQRWFKNFRKKRLPGFLHWPVKILCFSIPTYFKSCFSLIVSRSGFDNWAFAINSLLLNAGTKWL